MCQLTASSCEGFICRIIMRSSFSPAAGHALWLDQRKARCLVLWRRLPEVAAAIAAWAAGYGVSDSVMLLDELANGAEVRGTGEEGAAAGWALLCDRSCDSY